MTKVFITQYSLTKGIIEENAKITEHGGNVYAYVKGEYVGYTIGKEAFYTIEEALKNAEERRIKKIASLKKQIEKLEKMKFNVEKK